VLRHERLAVCLVGNECGLVLERGERQVGREPLLGVGDCEMGARLRTDQLRELFPMDAAEARVEAAPARDAVDVDGDLAARQVLQLLPAERDRLLDLAEDAEVPGREIGVGDGARVEDRPLLGEVLAWWKACRVEASLDELLLRFRPEERQPTAPGYAASTATSSNRGARGSCNPR
jgi:hypothetical protein